MYTCTVSSLRAVHLPSCCWLYDCMIVHCVVVMVYFVCFCFYMGNLFCVFPWVHCAPVFRECIVPQFSVSALCPSFPWVHCAPAISPGLCAIEISCIIIITLKYRRDRCDLFQVYKITNQIGDLKFETFFFTPTKSDITRNAECKLYVEYGKTNVRKFPFSNRIVPTWNALSLTIKSDCDS